MGHGQGTGASDSCQHVWLACWKPSCILWKKLEKKHCPWTLLVVADSHRKYNLPKELMDNVMWQTSLWHSLKWIAKSCIKIPLPIFLYPICSQSSLNILRIIFCLKCSSSSSKTLTNLFSVIRPQSALPVRGVEETTDHSTGKQLSA